MHIERKTVSVTTAADGSATSYSAVITGRILEVRYAKTDFADGVDFTITLERSGANIWTDTNINASERIKPIAQAQGVDGADIADEYGPIYACQDRVKIVIASGGDTKSGAFEILVG